MVLHVNGLHAVHLDFCACERVLEYGLPRQQLLRRQWFPATFEQPQTCATFSMLDHFQMATLQAKVTMYDYYSALEKLTDNSGLYTPRVSHRAFFPVKYMIACTYRVDTKSLFGCTENSVTLPV